MAHFVTTWRFAASRHIGLKAHRGTTPFRTARSPNNRQTAHSFFTIDRRRTAARRVIDTRPVRAFVTTPAQSSPTQHPVAHFRGMRLLDTIPRFSRPARNLLFASINLINALALTKRHIEAQHHSGLLLRPTTGKLLIPSLRSTVAERERDA